MKKKGYCQRCGRYLTSSSLKKEIKGDRFLCSTCYSKTNNKRTELKIDYLPEINGKVDTSIGKTKSVVRSGLRSKGNGVLLREEREFLNKKYGYDPYNSNSKSCSQLYRLRDALRFKKKKIETEHKTDLNDKFLEGLPQ